MKEEKMKLARSRGKKETSENCLGTAGLLTFPGAASADPGLGSGPVWSGCFYSLGGLGVEMEQGQEETWRREGKRDRLGNRPREKTSELER